eukprot:1186476-Prorocentrum_minimum.AAC.10
MPKWVNRFVDVRGYGADVRGDGVDVWGDGCASSPAGIISALKWAVWSSEDAEKGPQHRLQTMYSSRCTVRKGDARLRVFQAGSGTQDLSILASGWMGGHKGGGISVCLGGMSVFGARQP